MDYNDKIEVPSINEVVPSLNSDNEVNFEYLESLNNTETKKNYLGEILFKKIEHHPMAQINNFTFYIISKITGMILDLEDFCRISEIINNNDILTKFISKAYSLLQNQDAYFD